VSEEAAILALIETGSVTAAAEAVGLQRRTLGRWLRTPAFAEQYAAAKREFLLAGLGALNGLLSRAAQAILDALTDPGATHAVKLKAAELVYSRAMQGHELTDLENRIAALEAAQEGTQ
jgi:hypothetical protein